MDEDDLRAAMGEGPRPFPPRAPLTFKPWHKPRKQYVRYHQWSRELGFLARDLRLSDVLKYLTLPGSDLLDIRHLADTVCSDRKLRLRYLGFNTAEAAEFGFEKSQLFASQFSVNRLGSIDPESEVFPGDFRSVGDPLSVQGRRVRREGPFHAINLDLCGGFAGPNKSNGIPNYFGALKAVLQNQRGAEGDFLLFITTRVDDSSIDSNSRSSLEKVAERIHQTCEGYAKAFADAWGIDDPLKVASVASHAEPADVFLLGLTQWIITQGVDEGLKSSVRSFMTYRAGANDGPDNIASLAIRFSPDPYVRPDADGLVLPQVTSDLLADKICNQSRIVPERVRARVLVDVILRTQANEFEECVSQSAKLLAGAGYDENRYREWAMNDAGR